MVRVSTVRYFLVVLPPPAWLLAGFAAVALLGAWTVALDPRGVDTALAYLLWLQLLSASTGVVPAASRGFLDPLLVSGRSRVVIALGSLVAAALPGLVAWLAIVSASLYAGPDAIVQVFSLHRVAALVIVSAGAWAVGLALPRFAGGALWLLVMMGLAFSRAAFPRVVAIVEQPEGVAEILSTALACALCPLLFLGTHPGPLDPRVILLALAATTGLAGLAIGYLRRRDYTLQELA